MSELVHYEVADEVGTITLDSPANRNALSKQLVTELAQALATSATDDSKVVVVRSSQRVFCAGADLKEAGTGGMVEGAHALVALQRSILANPKPVVCRLDGPVRAGGLGIVAASDVVVCRGDVTFAFTESRLGLAPAVISLTVLPRLTPRAAADIFLSGRAFSAQEAESMGLVTRAADDVDAALAEVVGELLKAHPQGLRETKALLTAPLLARLDEGATEMAELSGRLFGSEAAKEAMTAFLTRR